MSKTTITLDGHGKDLHKIMQRYVEASHELNEKISKIVNSKFELTAGEIGSMRDMDLDNYYIYNKIIDLIIKSLSK